MFIEPTSFDLWLATHLAHVFRNHPQLQLVSESGIHHGVFGGLWYGAALFICGTQALRSGDRKAFIRIWTILAASAITLALTLIAGAIFTWPPPAHYPGISEVYAQAYVNNLNASSFPSQSTAVYACVAAGIYSLHKTFGWILWAILPVTISLPRMLNGGHYFSDIVVGLALSVASYAVARYALECQVIAKVDSLLGSQPILQSIGDLVLFAWILQVTVEFRDAIWVLRVFGIIFGKWR